MQTEALLSGLIEARSRLTLWNAAVQSIIPSAASSAKPRRQNGGETK